MQSLEKGAKIGVTSVSFAGDADLMSANNRFVYPNDCALGQAEQLQISKARTAGMGVQAERPLKIKFIIKAVLDCQ